MMGVAVYLWQGRLSKQLLPHYIPLVHFLWMLVRIRPGRIACILLLYIGRVAEQPFHLVSWPARLVYTYCKVAC
jgi:hypothetical protein